MAQHARRTGLETERRQLADTRSRECPPGSLHSVKYAIGRAIIQPLPVRCLVAWALEIIPVATTSRRRPIPVNYDDKPSQTPYIVEVEQASHFARRDVMTIEPNAELRCRAPAQLVDGGPQTTVPVVPGWIRAELASSVLGCRRRTMRDDVPQTRDYLQCTYPRTLEQGYLSADRTRQELYLLLAFLAAAKARGCPSPNWVEVLQEDTHLQHQWSHYYNLMNAKNLWLKLRESPTLKTTKRETRLDATPGQNSAGYCTGAALHV
ncbi:hypothetical protein DFH09DRAFT_1082265 [Mycena vulgaris]|nr:hypothetical protein DFH09DRAFT_1082265 [Mycena vulgaris]